MTEILTEAGDSVSFYRQDGKVFINVNGDPCELNDMEAGLALSMFSHVKNVYPILPAPALPYGF